MDQYDHQIKFSSICRSVTYIFMVQQINLLKTYLLQKSCTWDKTDIVNYILLYIIVINLKIFNN